MRPKNKLLTILIVTGIFLFIIIKIFSFFANFHLAMPERQKTPQSQTSANPNTDAGFNRANDHLKLTKHAKCRMDCRHITEDELKEILHDGNINYNKSELNDSRGPKYALEGYTSEHQHLRIIFAPEVSDMVVVTCIDLDTEWQCPSCN